MRHGCSRVIYSKVPEPGHPPLAARGENVPGIMEAVTQCAVQC